VRTDRKGDGRIRFTKVSLLNDQLDPVEVVTTGQDVVFAFEFDIHGLQRVGNVLVHIAFSGVLAQPVFACLSRVTKGGLLTLTPGCRVLCRIPRMPLLPGMYTYSISCKISEVMADAILDAGKLSVAEGDYFGTGRLPPNQLGDVVVAHDWSLE